MLSQNKVAVITGGNAGIGLTVCDRLLALHKGLELCLLCRNVQRAESARQLLLSSHPNATIIVVVMDTSDVRSVFQAARELKKKYHRIDYLYLNAGIMPVEGVNWNGVLKGIFSSKCAHVLSTGEGCLYHTDTTTKEGLKNIFASNVFGHFTLVKEIEDRLGGDSASQIVWTSSRAAGLSAFDPKDVQHKKGENPYASSKFVIDTVSVSMNKKLNDKKVYSTTTCPGLVMTNLTDSILPAWMWKIIYPLLLFLRIFAPSLTISSYLGSEAMIWLTTQDPNDLDTRTKYCVNSDPLGKPYIKTVKLNIDQKSERVIMTELEDLYKSFKDKYS